MGITDAPPIIPNDGLLLRNAKATGLRYWRAAVAGARAGEKQAHLCCFGDSITQGFNGNLPLHQNSGAAYLKRHVDDYFGVVTGTGVIGAADVDLDVQTGEDRIVEAGPGWSDYLDYGPFERCRTATGTANTITFTATGTACDIWYQRLTTGGTWTYTVDGGAPVSVNSNGGILVTRTQITGLTDTEHVIVITAPETNSIYFLGIEMKRGGNYGVKVSRFASSGAASAELVTVGTGKGLAANVGMTKPDLAFLIFGTNDWNQQTPLATFEANLLAFEASLEANDCDLALVMEPSGSAVKTIVANEYRDVMKKVAAATGSAFMDIHSQWGGYTLSKNAPFALMSNDTLHPSHKGQAALGQAFINLFTALL